MEDFSFEPVSPAPPPKGLRPATFHPPPPPPPNEFPDPGYLQEEISLLRSENTTLQVILVLVIIIVKIILCSVFVALFFD